MAPWIQNVSLVNIRKGFHYDAGINSMLIQIVDPDMEFPKPFHQFLETHQFKFLDMEKADDTINDKFKIQDDQAQQLVDLLQHALHNHMNVVVHCVAGVCRSGAVVEVGRMLGFLDTEDFRSPNLLVKHKMMKCLGWEYDENEPHTVNGYTTQSGRVVPAKTVDYNNDNEKVFALAQARREYRQNKGE